MVSVTAVRSQFPQLEGSLSSQLRGVCIGYHGYYSALKCNGVCDDILCTIKLWLGSNIKGYYYSGPCYADENLKSKLCVSVCVCVCDNKKPTKVEDKASHLCW